MNKQDTNILSTSTSGSSGWVDVSQFQDWTIYVQAGGTVKVYVAYGKDLNAPYNAFTDYNIGDNVQYNGTSYACIKANVSAQGILPTNATYWAAISGIQQGPTLSAGQIFSNQSVKDNASSPSIAVAHFIQVVAQSNTQTNVNLFARAF